MDCMQNGFETSLDTASHCRILHGMYPISSSHCMKEGSKGGVLTADFESFRAY